MRPGTLRENAGLGVERAARIFRLTVAPGFSRPRHNGRGYQP